MPGRRTAAIELAAVARDAALEVGEVVAVTAGPGGFGATYGPGRRIDGIRVHRAGEVTRVTVCVCLRYPSPIQTTGDAVRTRVAAALRDAFPDEAGPQVVIQVVDLAPAGDGSAGPVSS